MLHTAIKDADVLKEQLREIAGDDIDTLRDTLEGEIDLHGLICLAAAENLKDVTLAKAIREMEDELSARRDRIEKRISLRKTAILSAMQAAELKTIETPAGTLSRRAVPPSCLVVDEAQIPSEFWKASEPKLDKRSLLDALKAGRPISGAMLSNGGETLSSRI